MHALHCTESFSGSQYSGGDLINLVSGGGGGGGGGGLLW